MKNSSPGVPLRPMCFLLLLAVLFGDVADGRRILASTKITIVDSIELDEISTDDAWDFEEDAPIISSARALEMDDHNAGLEELGDEWAYFHGIEKKRAGFDLDDLPADDNGAEETPIQWTEAEDATDVADDEADSLDTQETEDDENTEDDPDFPASVDSDELRGSFYNTEFSKFEDETLEPELSKTKFDSSIEVESYQGYSKFEVDPNPRQSTYSEWEADSSEAYSIGAGTEDRKAIQTEDPFFDDRGKGIFTEHMDNLLSSVDGQDKDIDFQDGSAYDLRFSKFEDDQQNRNPQLHLEDETTSSDAKDKPLPLIENTPDRVDMHGEEDISDLEESGREDSILLNGHYLLLGAFGPTYEDDLFDAYFDFEAI